MENNTPKEKKILFTYFTNYGIFSRNIVCSRVVSKIKDILDERNDYIDYLTLETKKIPNELNDDSNTLLNDTLSTCKYKYIISIGLGGFVKSCLLERLTNYDKCYIFSQNDIVKFNHANIKEKKKTKDYIKKIVDIKNDTPSNNGACCVVRDILINHATNIDKECKIEFIHIPIKYGIMPILIATFIANKIKTMLNLY